MEWRNLSSVLLVVACYHPAVAREKVFHVYMLAAESGVLYLGMTNDLMRRMCEHRTGKGDAFSFRYKTFKLVWFEPYGRPAPAIEREKQIKRWRREKKVRLIEVSNPNWRDLSPLLR
jgi:putative endonuclease